MKRSNVMNFFPFLLEASGDAANNAGNSGWLTIVMLVLMVVFFYFFLIRPQKKQEKEAANMRNALEIGDEIVTIGGIVGQVVSIKEETITIVSGKDRTKIRFLKSAVREVTVKASGEPTAATPEKKKAAPIEAAPVKEEPKAEEPSEAPVDAPATEEGGEEAK